MKIGIYGGTFDPPHLGHMEAARAAMAHLTLDRLYLIPTMLPPHKFLPQGGADAGHRMAMARMMADGLGPGAQVLDLEITREGPSYTVDTVKVLRQQNPKAELFLLMGTDMFLSFETWREPAVIAKEATLAPFAREEGGSHELFAVQSEALREKLGARIDVVPMDKIHPISSTNVRRLLGRAETVDEGGALLWPPVYGYILRNKLYGTDVNLKKLTHAQLRAVSCSMIRAKRIPHVKGVEETAAALAERWGVDAQKARRAAILHDCTKYLDLGEQLALCRKYGIVVDELEQESTKMLHAKTGAALAEHLFGEAADTCAAISCHTTGRPDMTAFDKVLYVADYVEPTRDFDGVEVLRALAWEDLDRAVALGLETTVEELREKGAIIHPNTKNTLEQLRGRYL